jgi:hypothetical protein
MTLDHILCLVMMIIKKYLNMVHLEIIKKDNMILLINLEYKLENKDLESHKLWILYKIIKIGIAKLNGIPLLNYKEKIKSNLLMIKLFIPCFLMTCPIIFTQLSKHLKIIKIIQEFGEAQLSLM